MLGTLHPFACWVLVIGNGLAGIWALAASRVLWLRTAWLWWFTGFVQLWVFVQLTIAALHLNANEGAPESFHVFYGVLSAVTVTILYSYKGQLNRHQNALYGWGGLFIMGLGIRALVLL